MSSRESKTRRFGVRTSALDNASKIIDPSREMGTPTQLIDVSKIDMEEGNLRKILIDIENPHDIDDSNPRAAEMRAQLEEIEGLAATIKSSGLMNPIEVYRMGDRFEIATGQRRYLAHRMLGLPMIRASVLLKKPDALRTQQWVENEQRSNMSLPERVFGLREVFAEAGLIDASRAERAKYMIEAMGMKQSSAYRYLAIYDAPPEIHDAIRDGHLTSVTTAYQICSRPDDEVLGALQAYLDGTPPSEAGEAAAQLQEPEGGTSVEAPPTNPIRIKRARGRQVQSVKLGAVTKPSAVRTIMHALAEAPAIKKALGDISLPTIDWDDMQAVSKAWLEFVKQIEAAAE